MTRMTPRWSQARLNVLPSSRSAEVQRMRKKRKVEEARRSRATTVVELAQKTQAIDEESTDVLPANSVVFPPRAKTSCFAANFQADVPAWMHGLHPGLEHQVVETGMSC